VDGTLLCPIEIATKLAALQCLVDISEFSELHLADLKYCPLLQLFFLSLDNIIKSK